MIYFTSDLHFNHRQDFIYEARGFSSIEEHDAAIIERWNSIVSPLDKVYILGDLLMGSDLEYGESCLESLNGTLYVVYGNHETTNRKQLYMNLFPHIICLGNAEILKIEGYKFYLSHYPTVVTRPDVDKSLKKSMINLCGHTHTKDCWEDWNIGRIYHVELDAHDCYPCSWEKIIKDIEGKLR